MGAAECCECSATGSPDRVSVATASTDAVSPSKPKSKTFTREELGHKFDSVDLDGSGGLDMQELAVLFEDMKVKYTAKKLDNFFNAVDTDGGGVIGKDEFIDFFAGVEKKVGLGKLIQQKINENEEWRAANKKPCDVFIVHGMAPEIGRKRSWWASDVLEFTDLKCAGDFRMSSRGSMRGIERSTPDSEALSVEQCECACIFLDGLQPVSQVAMTQMKAAKKANLKICCLYEAETDAWRNLAPWKISLPEVFERPAVAISPSHFLSDSEQLLLNAVYAMLDKPPPFLGGVRPPGGDENDFSKLASGNVRWLKAEYTLALKAGMDGDDMPPDVYENPYELRPCYISYPQLDPSEKGLSRQQKACLKIAMKRSALEGQERGDRVFFLDQVSVNGSLLLLKDVDEVSRLLSTARFVILDEVSLDSVDHRPYLSRGPCFLEVMIVLLSGLMAPVRDGQFRQLDDAVGGELQEGINLRKWFRDNANDPRALLEALSLMLGRKDFASDEERDAAQMLLNRVLQKHPLLVPGPQWSELPRKASSDQIERKPNRRGTCPT